MILIILLLLRLLHLQDNQITQLLPHRHLLHQNLLHLHHHHLLLQAQLQLILHVFIVQFKGFFLLTFFHFKLNRTKHFFFFPLSFFFLCIFRQDVSFIDLFFIHFYLFFGFHSYFLLHT